MAGRNGSQRKGLFAGFLTGAALCLSLGAGATYLSPLQRGEGQAAEPTVDTVEINPTLPAGEAPDVAIITPKSDFELKSPEAPSNEQPETDRDDGAVAANVRDAIDPVQTGTSEMETPPAAVPLDAETADVELVAPTVQKMEPLATSEPAPEQNVAEIDVKSPADVKTAPSAEVSDISQPGVEDAPAAPSSTSPQVEAADADTGPVASLEDPRPELDDVPVEPAEKPSATIQAPVVAAPQAAEAPKADVVIALNQPPVTALKPPLVAPTDETVETAVPESDTESASTEPVLSAPAEEEATLSVPEPETLQPTPSPDAPEQVAAPRVDAEPEAPVLDGAEAGSEGEAAGDEPAQRVDRRNPPPPTFEGRAFDAFAARFVPPNDKPFLAIVLEHIGDGSVDMYDLLNFGRPITFAVNSNDPLAKFRESEFRKARFEVAVLVPDDPSTGLSESMTDAGIPLRLDDYLTAVPGAVAVLDRADSDFYRDPRKVTAVASELKTTGRGLLIHEKFGVNRALEAARSEGIPAASLVRVIDEQRDAASIRRALDRAALDASKTGAAIVFGRTHPETVAAILPWLLGNSARSVTIAPLTATMNRIEE